MSGLGVCRDFSLLARLHYRIRPGRGGAVALRAIEVIPIQGTQLRPRRRSSAQAATRIAALNAMSNNLDRQDGTHYGVTLTPMTDGSGLYCRPGVANDSDRIGRLCRLANNAGSGQPLRTPEVPPPCGGNEVMAGSAEPVGPASSASVNDGPSD